jgi:hypothetical protein
MFSLLFFGKHSLFIPEEDDTENVTFDDVFLTSFLKVLVALVTKIPKTESTHVPREYKKESPRKTKLTTGRHHTRSNIQ